MKTLIYTLSALMLLVACREENLHLPTDFSYEIPPEEISEDVNVGAYFYHYNTEDWNQLLPFEPLQGKYDALSPEVMVQQRTWADQAGVDFFIFSWNHTGQDEALISNFVTGRNQSVKMVINYNLAHLNAKPDAPLVGAKLDSMINDFRNLAASHFRQDYYFAVNGQPVVLISPVNLPVSLSASVDFPSIVAALNEAMTAAGIDLYLMGEITEGWLPPQRYSPSLRAMDAVVLKDWATENYDRSVFFASFSDQNWSHWNDSTEVWGIDFVPCIFPGFTDKAMNPESVLYDIERSETFYTDYSNVAKRNLGDSRIVLVNSWNNFQRGTALEPAQTYGTTYLDITRTQFTVNP